MAEDVKVNVIQQEPKVTTFYNLAQEPPTIYVDTWGPSTGASDVRIKFGDIIDRTGDEQIARHAFTIAMTHDSFLNFVSALDSIAEFLRTAYGGNAPTTANLPPERVAELTAKYAPKP